MYAKTKFILYENYQNSTQDVRHLFTNWVAQVHLKHVGSTELPTNVNITRYYFRKKFESAHLISG